MSSHYGAGCSLLLSKTLPVLVFHVVLGLADEVLEKITFQNNGFFPQGASGREYFFKGCMNEFPSPVNEGLSYQNFRVWHERVLIIHTMCPLSLVKLGYLHARILAEKIIHEPSHSPKDRLARKQKLCLCSYTVLEL